MADQQRKDFIRAAGRQSSLCNSIKFEGQVETLLIGKPRHVQSHMNTLTTKYRSLKYGFRPLVY